VLRGFGRDIFALLRKYRKGLLLTFSGLGLVVFVLVGIMAHESAKPEFCTTCHIMEPYYESWKESSHRNVNCLLCHFKPGWQGYIRGKVVALSQLVRYVTVTYGSKPWAEIPDESCMRSGCHEGAKLKGPIEYQMGVSFDHEHHLADLRRGKKLRCTSCHSQIVQGTHMKVTESVCFICHFKPAEDGQRDPAMTDCRKCHQKGISTPGAPVEHALFIERGTDCTKCHFSITRGEGTAQRHRCESCHAESRHLGELDTEKIHRNHVANHNVECFECHDPIEHRLETAQELAQPDCGICHAEQHQVQKTFYAGAADVPFQATVAGPMVEAHIACSGCHFEREPGDTATTGTLHGVARASGKACEYCHGAGYDRLLESWKEEIVRRKDQLQGLARIAGTAAPASGDVTAATQAIETTLDAITRAHAVHNINYSATLIDLSQATLLESTSGTAVGAILRSWTRDEMPSFGKTPSCLQDCHYGVSNRTIVLKNQGRVFPHAPHVNRAGLDCGTCHSREQHKVSLPRGYECITCHHQNAKGQECASCHQETVRFATGEFGGYGIASPQNADCRACHTNKLEEILMLNREACAACHENPAPYLTRLEAERKELAALAAEVKQGFEARWGTLDFEGLQMADKVRTVSGLNGIHNYPLAKKIYAEGREYLARAKKGGEGVGSGE